VKDFQSVLFADQLWLAALGQFAFGLYCICDHQALQLLGAIVGLSQVPFHSEPLAVEILGGRTMTAYDPQTMLSFMNEFTVCTG
jgi:hypothetical protein